MQKNGFTLIELAIVLVIVGLLIGGIMTGQTLVTGSKVNKQVSQIQQFDSAVATFRAEYSYLPGDITQFGGDGDGIIDQTSGTGATDNNTNRFMYEPANFWITLDPEQFPGPSGNGTISSSTVGIAALSSGTTKNVPLAAGGKDKSFIVASAAGTSASTYLTASASTSKNYYIILESTQLQTTTGGYYAFTPTTTTNSAFKPRELAALDKKIDDGLANSGTVVSGSINATTSGVADVANGICSSTTTYNVNNDVYECTPFIQIGSQAGATK